MSNDDVITLLLKSQFNHINHLDDKLNEVTKDMAHLKVQFESLRADVKTDVADLKTQFESFRADVKTDLVKMDVKFAQLSENVQKAINRNMQWSIGLIAFIVTALKVIDMVLGK